VGFALRTEGCARLYYGTPPRLISSGPIAQKPDRYAKYSPSTNGPPARREDVLGPAGFPLSPQKIKDKISFGQMVVLKRGELFMDLAFVRDR
jgi:hypothetical protein